MPGLQRTVDPTVEPVALWELRDHLRIGNNSALASAITKANPGSVTSLAHGLAAGDVVRWYAASGMVELDGVETTVTLIDTDTFTIGVNTTGYTTADGSEVFLPVHVEDRPLADKLSEAIEYCQDLQALAYLTQTWVLTLDDFPRSIRPIVLPRPPLQSVTSIEYVDADGDDQTLDASVYVVDTSNRLGGRIALAVSESWPSVWPEIGGVDITFKAGYGDAAADVPRKIRAAIKLFAGHLYENREAVVDAAAIRELPLGIDALLRRDSAKHFG